MDSWVKVLGQRNNDFYYILKKYSEYHPESDENEIQTGDKCYQIIYFIRILDEQAKIIFDPVLNS